MISSQQRNPNRTGSANASSRIALFTLLVLLLAAAALPVQAAEFTPRPVREGTLSFGLVGQGGAMVGGGDWRRRRWISREMERFSFSGAAPKSGGAAA